MFFFQLIVWWGVISNKKRAVSRYENENLYLTNHTLKVPKLESKQKRIMWGMKCIDSPVNPYPQFPLIFFTFLKLQ